jgi:hypothetical protein
MCIRDSFKGTPALDINAEVQYTIMDGRIVYHKE